MLITTQIMDGRVVKEFEIGKRIRSKEFRQVLENVKLDGDQIILKEDGLPQAAILSLDDLALLERAKSMKDKSWKQLRKVLHRVHQKNADFLPEEVDQDVDAAVLAVRRRQL